MTTGGITKRLDRLESQGLVVRKDANDDGRGKLVGLTGQGVRLVDRLIAVHLENERHLLAGLSPRQRQQLQSLLARLAEGLEEPTTVGSSHNHTLGPATGPATPSRDVGGTMAV